MSHRYVSQKREQFLAREKDAKKDLAIHNVNKTKRVNRRKSAADIMTCIDAKFIDHDKFIRDQLKWKSKSYNLKRQIEDFIKWVYCIYPIPRFMFNVFSDEPTLFRGFTQKEKLEWFFTVAQGGSFNKQAKGILTKKEAHLFLQAPDSNTFDENLWWVKCKSLELSNKITNAISTRFFQNLEIRGPFWYSLLMLLKKDESVVTIENLSDVMDFLRDRHGNQRSFNLKGRTFNSLIKLSNQWHRDLQLKRFGSQNLRWAGLPIEDWSWKNKETKMLYTIKQLHTSKELYYEGRKMKHCIASYGHRCVDGNSAIFTLESNDGVNYREKHMTIEVDRNNRLVQAHGKMNRHVTGEPHLVFNKWMNVKNIG